jgi:hypothetical protein
MTIPTKKLPVHLAAAAAALFTFGVCAQDVLDDPVPGQTDEALPGDTTTDEGSAAGAAGGALDMDSRFGELDVDGDGSLTEDEVRGDADLSERFDTLDEDSDGSLTSDEFSAGADAEADAEMRR